MPHSLLRMWNPLFRKPKSPHDLQGNLSKWREIASQSFPNGKARGVALLSGCFHCSDLRGSNLPNFMPVVKAFARFYHRFRPGSNELQRKGLLCGRSAGGRTLKSGQETFRSRCWIGSVHHGGGYRHAGNSRVQHFFNIRLVNAPNGKCGQSDF